MSNKSPNGCKASSIHLAEQALMLTTLAASPANISLITNYRWILAEAAFRKGLVSLASYAQDGDE